MDPEERKKELFAKYNDVAMARGLELQGSYFLRTVHLADEMDPEFTEAWLTFIYDYMYTRGVLDDKIRTFMIVGEVIVSGHAEQLPNHMATAIRVGASPQELLEVILHSAVYFGPEVMVVALDAYRAVMEDLQIQEYPDFPARSAA